MCFEAFCEKINNVCSKLGLSAKFSKDSEAGKYIAKCSDGTTIVGNAVIQKVTYRWASGHQTMGYLPTV